jgi:NAD(P)H-flavin reductase
VRLDFDYKQNSWAVGQHFFLCFPALTVWQSHPLTVASVPQSPIPHHTYIVRCRKGETERLKSLVLDKDSLPATKERISDIAITTPVIMCGPYGTPLLSAKSETANILAIAGGTGVSLTLPVVLAATASTQFEGAAIDFVWIIRRASNAEWIATEILELKQRSREAKNLNLRVHLYVTQESDTSKPVNSSSDKITTVSNTESISPADSQNSPSLKSNNSSITYLNSQQPSLNEIVKTFMATRAQAVFRTRVIASGPPGMGRDLREAVAGCNDGAKVFRGAMEADVELHWDDRMG